MTDMIAGTFEPLGRGGGFLRMPEANYRLRQDDVFVPPKLIDRVRLRGGETLACTVGAAKGK